MPFQAQPYAPPVLYDPSRENARISALMLRQGEVSAQGARNIGDIAGGAVQQLGGQLGDYYKQKAADEAAKAQAAEQQKRSQAINNAIQNWDAKDPQSLFKGLMGSGIDAEDSIKITNGAVGVIKLSQQQDKVDWEAYNHALQGAAALYRQGGDEALAANWQVLKPALEPGAKVSGIQLSEQYNPQYGKVLLDVEQHLKGGGEDLKPGSEAWFLHTFYGPNPTKEQILKGREEWAASSKDTAAKTERETFGGVVHERQYDRQAGEWGAWKPLGASEGALNRAASEDKRAETQQQLSDKAMAAKQENDSQIKSAFAAMDSALQEVESYSGTKAITSPLEAANARQQYDAATKAFAATLSRATGDNRISDSDRRAYANLVAYAGPGSTLLNITRPDLARKRFTEAKKFFEEASKAKGTGQIDLGIPGVTVTKQ